MQTLRSRRDPAPAPIRPRGSRPPAAVRGVALTMALTGALLSGSSPVLAHGVAGKRFFPTTIAIEDPFANDELSLAFGRFKEPAAGDEPAVWESELEAEIAKRITPRFALSLGGAFVHRDPERGASTSGLANLEVGIKYQLPVSKRHEAVASVGFTVEVGDTGDPDVEADAFTTLSPSLFFGKGFGDLPPSAGWLRPLALTGTVAVNVPTDVESTIAGDAGPEVERHPVTVGWGVAVLYDLSYLQSQVRDLGLRAPFNRLVPVVEVALTTCVNRGCGGATTGTVNPGVLWYGKYVQLGLEAQIPMNARTGGDLGVRALFHVFMDDLFARSFGRPLRGRGD